MRKSFKNSFGAGRITLLLLFVLIACEDNKIQNLRIATATNMQFAMGELVKQFTAETGIGCDMVISSSGKLTAQIIEGAPYDIFISADMAYPQKIYDRGLAFDPPKIYAYGNLVLWSMNDAVKPALDMLDTEAVKHIAMANPKTAPYGVAAMEVLENSGLKIKIQEKLVYGESIAQTNQFIITKAAEIGFTAESVVLSPEMKGKGKWIALDAKTYSKIDQGMVRLKRKDFNNPNAQLFYEFMLSPKATVILKDFGYTTLSR